MNRGDNNKLAGEGVLGREVVANRTLSCFMWAITFIGFVTLSAWVRIPLPFTPVPVTLQTFFVLLSGAMLGRKIGSLSMIGYVALGAFGIPVFTTQLGLLGPTGGYLIGFIIAAWVVGNLIERGKSFVRCDLKWLVFSMGVGSLIILLIGMLQLSIFLNCGLKKAFLIGVLPFLPGDSFKTILAGIVYYKMGLKPQITTDKH